MLAGFDAWHLTSMTTMNNAGQYTYKYVVFNK